VEPLEPRVLLSGMTAATIRHAYGFDQLGLTGAGQTIAIIGAYDAATIDADLNVFSSTMGVPGGPSAGFLTKHKWSSRVAYDVGWAQELTLDVEWAHAIAPGAKILLVESASTQMSDLLSAVNWARAQAGVSVVSMSWGGTEFLGQASMDGYFSTPAWHGGITFVAASGDEGGAPSYPAMSTNVVSVGGTRLVVNSSGDYLTEAAWSGSGGGVSEATGAPVWQSFTGLPARIGPDVSYDADPATGVKVYGPTNSGGHGWMTFGGTSAGAPQWAGLIALANEGRAIAGLAPLDGATQTLPAIYAAPSSVFRDVTYGATNSWIQAGVGYDLATGRGSPEAVGLVQYLIGYNRVTPTLVRGSGMAYTRAAAVHSAAVPLSQVTGDLVLARAVEAFSEGSLYRMGEQRRTDVQVRLVTYETVSAAEAPVLTVRDELKGSVPSVAASAPPENHPLIVTSPVAALTVTVSDWVL
jgi:subtilase family serine protease